MKRNHFVALPILFLALLLASTAAAKPVVDEFENTSYPLSGVKRALVLPVNIAENISVPPSEPFFRETLEQRWDELVKSGVLAPLFVTMTVDQLLERDAFVSGTAPAPELSKDLAAQRAIDLSPQYADAIVSLTVTEARYDVVPQATTRSNWDIGVGIGWGGYYRRGGWGGGVYIPPPAPTTTSYAQSFAICAVKIEIRDTKSPDHQLIYGLSVHDAVRGGALPNTPSLTKVAELLLDTAAQTLRKK